MTSSRNLGFRALCWLMAFITAAMPSVTASAQSPQAQETELAYCIPSACVVVSARPKQLLSAPIFAMMPIEVLQAASLKEVGIDPLELERLLVSVSPSFNPPNYSVSAQFSNSVVGKLKPKFTQHTQPAQLAGRPLLLSQQPQMPSMFFPTDNVLVAGPESTLSKLASGKLQNTSDELLNRLQGATADDIYACVDIAPLRPLIQVGLMQTEVPEPFRPFLMAPNLIHYVEARLNFSGNGPTELIVEANSEADAEELMGLVDQAIEIVRQKVLVEAEKLLRDPDPVQQAMGKYQQRLVSEYPQMFKPTLEGKRLVLFRQPAGEGELNTLTSVAISGTLVALLLPAVQAAREAARRNASMNNMKQIMLSLLNYESARGKFPAHASYGDDGKPLLSWRVHMLPYLDQNQLYKQFRLDEPWDSAHNQQLIPLMPELFLDPSSRLIVAAGKTHYLGVQGDQNIFNGTNEGVKIQEIRDGMSNTITILQVNDDRAAIWTRPDDWELDKADPLKGLSNSLHPGGFLAGFADGHVKFISEQVDLQLFQHILTKDGGEVVNNF